MLRADDLKKLSSPITILFWAIVAVLLLLLGPRSERTGVRFDSFCILRTWDGACALDEESCRLPEREDLV